MKVERKKVVKVSPVPSSTCVALSARAYHSANATKKANVSSSKEGARIAKVQQLSSHVSACNAYVNHFFTGCSL
jgi:hypothetical protein